MTPEKPRHLAARATAAVLLLASLWGCSSTSPPDDNQAGTGGATGCGGSSGAPDGGYGQCATVDVFTSWPTGKGPLDIGQLAVDNFKSHTGDDYGGAGYAWTFAYVGSLQFTQLTGDSASNAKLISDFEPYASGAKSAPSNGPPGQGTTVDDRAFGDLPLEIFMENGDTRSLTLGQARADVQWSVTTSDGYTKDVRWWADDMFMITGLQVYAYRATGDCKYLTRAAKTMIAYLGKLQQADGLFWHTTQSHAYWGRANGWIASGMTELLLDLPPGPDRDAIMAGYRKQMDGLLNVQIADGADAGAWRQVLDVATADAESSCTAMFTFALTTALKNGWISGSNYSMAARRGWLAVVAKTNAQGQLDRVCPGTGAAPAGTLQQQQQFYTSITLGSNDTHGQAPLLWEAHALLRNDCPGVR
jgi:unsaturated rhamnogalacturonyl hydrolase